MSSTKKKSGRNGSLQRRVRGKEEIARVLRHLTRLAIDLDEEELEIESTFPDDSHSFGIGNYEVSRTLDLTDHPKIRDAVKRLVGLCHDALLDEDPDYDPDRCDRCVKSDCCWIDRIHLTEEERVRILEHLGVSDTPRNSGRYFDEDDDLAGYYQHMMRHKDGHCSFLVPSEGGIMRCSIYEARPQVCRDYDAGYCSEYSKLLPRRRTIRV